MPDSTAKSKSKTKQAEPAATTPMQSAPVVEPQPSHKPYGSAASVSKTGVIDVTGAANSAQAVQMVEDALALSPDKSLRTLDVNAGHLLLTRAVLAKIGLQIKKYGLNLNAVYSKVPQTQQAALDEGFFVKEAPAKPHLSSLEQLHQHLEQPGQAKPDTTKEKASETPGEAIGQLLDEQLAASNSSTPFKVNKETNAKDLVFDIPPQSQIQVTSNADTLSSTLLVKGTLRSGQVLRYPGHIVILGDAHAGSEITADGDIVIWGELRGIAHAGANGNDLSEVRAMKIEALQLRIADHIARRPDRMFYHKPQSNTLPSPEVARVEQGEIRVFKETFGTKA